MKNCSDLYSLQYTLSVSAAVEKLPKIILDIKSCLDIVFISQVNACSKSLLQITYLLIQLIPCKIVKETMEIHDKDLQI